MTFISEQTPHALSIGMNPLPPKHQGPRITQLTFTRKTILSFLFLSRQAVKIYYQDPFVAVYCQCRLSSLIGLWLKWFFNISLIRWKDPDQLDYKQSNFLADQLQALVDLGIDRNVYPGQSLELSPKKNKVLLLENSKHMTGAYRSALSLAKNLSNFEFQFCLPTDSELIQDLKEQGLKTYSLPFLELSMSWQSLFYLPCLLLNSIKIILLLRLHRIQILHVNDVYNLCGAVCKFIRPETNLVYHVRLLKSSYIKPIYPLVRWIVKSVADKIIFVSKAVERDFGLTRQAEVVYDCITEDFTSIVRQPFLTDDSLWIVYLANYIPGKGQDHGLEIFSQAARCNHRLKLRFVGGSFTRHSAFLQQLRQRVQKLELDDRVEFLEEVRVVAQAFNNASIFLNCSESESFSRTTLEALQASLPAVVYDCGGIRELFDTPELRECLIPFGDATSAVEQILALACNPGLRQRLGHAGKEYVEARFRPDIFSFSMEDIYKKLLLHRRIRQICQSAT